MEVTVENIVEVKADITIDQIRKYLSDHGWEVINKGHLWESWSKYSNGYDRGASIPMREDYGDFAECLARTVREISYEEKRKPGDVLLDIANILTNTEKV